MNYTEQLIGILATAELGNNILFEGVKMRVDQTTDGCDGCVFDTEGKANKCEYKVACMAYYRKDRESVVFTSK